LRRWLPNPRRRLTDARGRNNGSDPRDVSRTPDLGSGLCPAELIPGRAKSQGRSHAKRLIACRKTAGTPISASH
jgi:hypothetical protein